MDFPHISSIALFHFTSGKNLQNNDPMDEWPEEFEMSMYQTEDGSICLWRKVCDENFVRSKVSHF